MGVGGEQTKACTDAVANKHKKYRVVETLANMQAAAFQNSKPLKFVAGVLTHQGEFSSEFFDFIRLCAFKFKSLKFVSPDLCGFTPSQASARFLSDFKNAIYCSLANGFGRQLVVSAAVGRFGSLQ